jgi:hypothetical protein
MAFNTEVEEVGESVVDGGSSGTKSEVFAKLRDVRTELDLINCSKDVEDDLLNASLAEYQ